MPAAAGIPPPIAYIKVVAVKKLVVGFRVAPAGPPMWCALAGASFRLEAVTSLNWAVPGFRSFTLKKLECLKQAIALNTLAWNNGIGLWSYFVGF